MRRLFALPLLLLTAAAADAQAISRYTSTDMPCEEVRATIRNEGAAIMRYTSKRGNQLFARYVRDSRYCEYEERARTTYIPAADTDSCRVFMCVKIDFDNGGPLTILPQR